MDINSILVVAGSAIGGFLLASWLTPLIKLEFYKWGNVTEDAVMKYVDGIKDPIVKEVTLKSIQDLKADKVWMEKLDGYLDTLKKVPGPVDDLVVEAIKSAIDGFVE